MFRPARIVWTICGASFMEGIRVQLAFRARIIFGKGRSRNQRTKLVSKSIRTTPVLTRCISRSLSVLVSFLVDDIQVSPVGTPFRTKLELSRYAEIAKKPSYCYDFNPLTSHFNDYILFF